jgi:predicted lipid carrier protein YhbT
MYLSVTQDGLKAEKAGPVDVTFTATAEDFARLSLRLEDPDTLFFNRRLLIEGDTDLGLTLKNLLDAVDWDELAARMPLGLGRLAQALRRRTGSGDALAAQP